MQVDDALQLLVDLVGDEADADVRLYPLFREVECNILGAGKELQAAIIQGL